MTLKAAVVGTGFIGPVHVEALGRAGVEVTGILGSTPEKSQQAASDLGLPRGYSNLEEVLADESVDSVHLTTPNRFHFEQARAALNANKHVMCEKPLAMNSDESSQLVQLANSKQLAAGVAYNIRFYPLNHELADRIQRGSDDILHVTGSYVQDWLLYETDFNWRVVADEGGELRAVADIGTHWLDLVQFITGQPIVSVCADLRTIHPTRQKPIGGTETFTNNAGDIRTESVPVTTEDCGTVMLRFENGANGCLWVSQATAGRKNCLRFEIGCPDQSYAWNSESPNDVWIGNRTGANETLIRDPAGLGTAARRVTNYPGGHNEGFPDTFKQMFRAFYGYIETNDFSAPAPFATFADGHREILLCDAILHSHREQRWVDVKQAS